MVVPLDPFTVSGGVQLGSIEITISAGSMANILLPQILDVSTLLFGVAVVDANVDALDAVVPSDKSALVVAELVVSFDSTFDIVSSVLPIFSFG